MKLDYVSRIQTGLKRYKTIATNKATSRVLDGSYNSIYKGRSMNFEELREYVPGDDIKDIDWKATSRSQKVLVKQYIAEKKHNLMLVFDSNCRMLADSAEGEEKRDVGLISGGTLAYMVNGNGDYVAATFCDNKGIKFFPFKMGLMNIENILASYQRSVTYDNTSSLNKPLEYIIRNIRRRMIIVIVTDMEGILNVNDSLMRQLVLTHDVLLVNVSDADIFGKKVYGVNKENYLPAFITESKRLRRLQQKKKEELISKCDDKLKHFGIAMATVNTVSRVDASLIELLEKHKLRK